VNDLRGTGVAIEASWRRRLVRCYSKLLPWILLALMLTVGAQAVAHGENPYVTFTVLGGVYVLVEAGRWLPFLLGTPLIRSMLRTSVWSLVDLAVLLAGRRRLALRQEWYAHLAGENGHDPVTWPKVGEALGFVASAIRCRRSDVADAAWTPVEAVLKSRTLSNLFTLTPTALAALILFRHGGTIGLLGSAESVSAIYLMFYALVLAGRKYRDVKPPEPKARRAKE